MLPGVVPCYDAVYDPVSGESHLLLLDLSATHVVPVVREELLALRGVPPPARAEAVIDTIARFHARLWEHPWLQEGERGISNWYGTRDRFERHVERRRQEWDRFIPAFGADIPMDVRALYTRLVDRLPNVWKRGLGGRIGSGCNVTLVHGDCYLTQFLVPRSGIGDTYLVDWQGGWADIPTFDLTFLVATFWTPEQRRDGHLEERLLRHYLETLATEGVRDYDERALYDDYRLNVLFMTLHPVWDALSGASIEYWWPTMSCLVGAYRDWGCEELLG
jgi:hypothetical protein